MSNYFKVDIDLGCFNEYKSLEELVTISLYNGLSSVSKDGIKLDNLDKGAKCALSNSFQVVMMDCAVKENRWEFDYTSSSMLEVLDKLASATNLKCNFDDMLKNYIRVMRSIILVADSAVTFNLVNMDDNYPAFYKEAISRLTSDICNFNIMVTK